MPPFSFSSRCAAVLPKACVAALVTLASIFAGSTAFSQGYSTGFDASQGYANGDSLTGSAGWDSNDLDKTPTTSGYSGEYVGQSDFVGTVTGYGSSTDYVAYLGGGEHGTAYPYVLPGAQTVYDFHQFALGTPTAYAFNVDMAIASSTSYPTRDSFGFTFLNSASGATIGTSPFSLNFTPATAANLMNVGYTLNGTTTPTGDAVFYNSIYHLTISVNVTAKTATVSLTPMGGTAMTVATIALGTTSLAGVQEIAPTWILASSTKDANGGYTGAGGNELIINNYAVTVPEPSTWAVLGFGAGLFGLMLRRRAARV